MPPNTKTTTKKEFKCPMCPVKTYNLGAMKEHLASCGLQKMEKRYTCTAGTCTYRTNRLANLNRHRKRHDETKAKESDGEWAKNDPGNLSDILGDLSTDTDADVTQGISSSFTGCDYIPVRKPTRPAKVFVPPPKPVLPSVQEVPSYDLPTVSVVTPEVPQSEILSSTRASSSVVTSNSPTATQIEHATSELPPRRMAASLHPPRFALKRSRLDNIERVDVGTQTLQPAQKTTRWTITRWTDNGKDYEEIQLVEDLFGAI